MQPVGPFFDKIVMKKDDLYHNDLKGCIALTKDSRKRRGFLHRLIYIAQKIHAFFFNRRNADADFNHGLLVLGGPDESNRLRIAHSVFSGVNVSYRNYPAEEDVTEFVIYRPKDKNLRDLIARYGENTAYDKNNPAQEGKSTSKFSIVDMVRSFFRVRKSMPDRVFRRVANITANLLDGERIKNKKGKCRKFFCTAYAMTVLQGSMLINAMTEDERLNATAERIYEMMTDKNHTVGTLFNNHSVFKENARFLMTSYAAETLDKCQKSSIGD